jgi:DNA repair protein RadD
MSFKLRPYQSRELTASLDFVRSAAPGAKRLIVAPCGSGKGTLQLSTLDALRREGRDAWLITPSLEIIRGNISRLGREVPESGEALARAAWDIGITTPVRLMNRLASGEVQAPEVVLWDEVHGAVESNSVPDTLFTLLAEARWLGYTATPFRATARGTAALLELWGEPTVLLTLPQAQAGGFVMTPRFAIVPLVDDDAVNLTNGELDAAEVTAAYSDQLSALVDLIHEQVIDGRRTVVAVSTTATALQLAAEMESRGVEARTILQDTTPADRAAAYALAEAGGCVLIQIRVLSTGVDLPALDCLVDAQPTLSPVLWLQTTGRVMRTHPGKAIPLVLTTNRNLERFHYLMEGLVPSAVVAEAQEAFGSPSPRAGGGRTLGFERLSRFRQLRVRLDAGGWLTFYNLFTKDGGKYREFFVGFAPWTDPSADASRDPQRAVYCASRVTGQGHYGKWARVPVPAELSGFGTSSRTQDLSAKMRSWWERGAKAKGLVEEDHQTVDRRDFVALPVACDARWNYHPPRDRTATPSGPVTVAEERVDRRTLEPLDPSPVGGSEVGPTPLEGLAALFRSLSLDL